jgi:protein arginine N-methyltransferase 7
MVIGEPNFSASLLPWHNLLFWFSFKHIIPIEGFKAVEKVGENGNELSTAGKICKLDPQFLMPKQAQLWAVPVYYHDLWKIRAPLQKVEGFNMNEFDCLIMVGNIYTCLVPKVHLALLILLRIFSPF